MSFDHIHHCPRCELRFEFRSELEDHVRTDHEGSGIVADAHERPQRKVPAPGRALHVMAILDPTRPASPTVDVALAIAKRARGALELVSVASPGLPLAAVDSFLRVEREHISSMAASSRRLTGESVVETLLEHIAEADPDLVVLASHGRSPIGETLLGSVSSDLVRSSSAPTLLVGPGCAPMTTVNELIVAVDGSADSLSALDVAMSVAQKLGVGVNLVEVATEPVAPPGVPMEDVLETSELHRIASRTEPPVRSWDVLHGPDVAGTLVDHVVGNESAILVLGTHGRSPGRPRVVGSVAARTIRHATVPVLTVSPEATAHWIDLASSRPQPARPETTRPHVEH